MCAEYGSSNSDNSKGVHAPFLCESLLIATINYIRSYYVLPAANGDLQAAIDTPMLSPTLNTTTQVSTGFKSK